MAIWSCNTGVRQNHTKNHRCDIGLVVVIIIINAVIIMIIMITILNITIISIAVSTRYAQ